MVVASANPDKAAEIESILRAELDGSIELLARPAEVPEVEETGETLEENARLKAMALAVATGIPALADDTGLEVDALGGAPGVLSARYAGPHATYADNVEKLLAELRRRGAMQPAERRATFHTVAVARFPGGAELAAEGSVGGVISEAPRGSGGFGYDPVFVPDEGDGLSFGQMTPEEKHVLSHRGRAFRALARMLEGAAGESGTG
ncbi:MAG: RdgB/HAM1 family non-canonical purine NTP pyrophosphatase [Acidimicrobiales bacterium]|jgi:XTP/dITP diphosphohydrolase|nr:RdgB/HAM1 family non-canonical purine NTP pyrophosphatase [Actinomycetota bacterium]MDA8186099.1 RdgB/HAM1 family non-canonical purine NTP pyrophosphatase [Actinomycetota bacterium]